MEDIKNVLVSDNVKNVSADIYDKLESVLQERFGSGNYRIYSVSEYNSQPKKERESIWNGMRFVFFHAGEPIRDFFNKAFECGIPLILVRDAEIPEDWCARLQDWGVVSEEITDLERIKKMLYLIDNELDDIRGAIRWVNDYYHPLKKQALKKALKKEREKEDELREKRNRLLTA